MTAAAVVTIPDELRDLRQFVLWKYEVKDNGKPTKVPYQVNGRKARTSDPTTWASYEDVLEAYQKNPGEWEGIGYVFSENDPYCGIDLDHCIDDAGKLKAWAQPIIATFGDTYMEVSPSGGGVKIWSKAKLPGAGRSKKDDAGEGIEVYDKGRYFTLTGNAWNGAPLQIENHQKDVERLYELVAGSKTGKPQPISNGKIPHGQQHDMLVSLAGSMRRRGMSPKAIFAALWETNTSECEVPGPEANIRGIAESACRNWQPDPRTAETDWRDHLILNRDGNPRAILANAMAALRLAPDWAGVLAFNEFSLGTVALKAAPWAGATTGGEWSDHEDRLTANWLQHQGIFVSMEIAGQAVQSVARDRHIHPVREYLDSLKWDGTKRIDTWLSLYLGAETNDYTAAVGARWLISGVARIYKPGVKVDCCPILEAARAVDAQDASNAALFEAA